MKTRIVSTLIAGLFLTAAATAQTTPSEPARRPRVVVSQVPLLASATTPTPTPAPAPRPSTPSPTPTPQRPVVIVGSAPPVYSPTPSPTPVIVAPRPSPSVSPTPAPTPFNSTTTVVSSAPPTTTTVSRGLLGWGTVRNGLIEAKRALQTRPAQISQIDGSISHEFVTLAVMEPKTSAMQTITIPKETFLTKDFETFYMSSQGKYLRVRTIRANGVNTAVTVFDDKGNALVPLVVQYPIERGGAFAEMAYYTSAHPALLSPEVSRAGQLYLRTTFETALKRLRERGKYISPEVISAAEELAVIEHVDHQRFLNESRPALYDEIFTLFALNEGNTYRFAVSSAGAGGLVQMIPSTYRMVRTMHPTVPLMPDFVTGMRDHVNAAQAMLLYMQDTWLDLQGNETIALALENGTATPAELMAAGYNSNPARLPLYVKRGGSNWRILIPRETQMYLQIQRSVQTTIQKLPPIKVQ